MSTVRQAFTLIEVVTAVSITVFLALIAVPRYSELVDRQEFSAAALQVVRCVQLAQTEAAAPVTTQGRSARWIVASLQNAQGATALTCQVGAVADTNVALQSNQPTFSALPVLTPDDADASPGDARLTIPDVRIVSTQLAEGSSIRWYFGVRERGRLAATRYQVGGSYTESVSPAGGWTLESTRRANVELRMTVPDSGLPITVQ
jgi:Tfp pilus assembly major pilin PilA